jgi:undecaprenyl diphosphate synthase
MGPLARARGIKHVAAYMFSTENWERSREEVEYLMNLLRDFIQKSMEEVDTEDMRIRIVGQRERFAPDIQKMMRDLEERTAQKDGGTFWCCLSYGGRAEIVAAAREAAAAGEEITEASLANHLWTSGMPDPDLIIRTSGEQRLSGFLTWQSVYSELFFIDTKWPDFSEAELDRILEEYAARERRYGT